MACGQCSCGGHHQGGGSRKSQDSLVLWVGTGVAIALFAAVGLAIGLEPPAEKPPVPAAAQPVEKPGSPANAPAPSQSAVSPYVLGHSVKRIDGTEESLESYKGKVVLIVNVASKCGFTKQYAGLEKLYKEKKDAGLVILGFPANDFRAQEPGTNAEIAEFCKNQFGVSFPMFEKIAVLGEQQHPLYKQLAAQPAPIGGDPKWNFTKFLVDRSGKVVARYDSAVKPDDAALTQKIDELLNAK